MGKNNRILILGGLGFIGKNLFLQLKKNKFHVDILSTAALNKDDIFYNMIDPKNIIIGDIRELNILENILPNYYAIYNLAGLSGAAESNERPIIDNEVNCKGHLNILETCRKKNPDVLIIFPSTRLVYGKPEYLPVDEHHPLNPDSIYAIHKMTAEFYYQLYFRLHKINSIILRISNPYGPYQDFENHKYGILNFFIHQALKGNIIKVYGNGQQERDFLFIEDLTRLLLSILKMDQTFGNIFNVGFGRSISIHQSLYIIKKYIKNLSFKLMPWPKEYEKIETGNYITDIKKISKFTKWSPEIDFESGIKKTIEFYSKQVLGLK